jgi:quercetin dioxygenase-like cupin family protein
MTFSLRGTDGHPWYTTEGGLYVPSGEGITKWFSGDVYTVKLRAEQTDGALGLIEATVPPGSGPVPHAHAEQDETFYVLSGELEFLQGERTFTARTGDLVFCPRRIRHGFHNSGLHSARTIFFYTPGGTEQTFIEGGDEPEKGVPVQPWGPERLDDRFMEILEKHGTIALPDDP